MLDSGPTQQLHSQFSAGDLTVAGRQRNINKFSQNGRLGHSCARVMKSRLCDSQVRDHAVVGLCVSSYANNCGCLVDGNITMATI